MTEHELLEIAQAEIRESGSPSGRTSFTKRRKYWLFGSVEWEIGIRLKGGKKWLFVVVDDSTGNVLRRTEASE